MSGKLDERRREGREWQRERPRFNERDPRTISFSSGSLQRINSNEIMRADNIVRERPSLMNFQVRDRPSLMNPQQQPRDSLMHPHQPLRERPSLMHPPSRDRPFLNNSATISELDYRRDSLPDNRVGARLRDVVEISPSKSADRPRMLSQLPLNGGSRTTPESPSARVKIIDNDFSDISDADEMIPVLPVREPKRAFDRALLSPSQDDTKRFRPYGTAYLFPRYLFFCYSFIFIN